VIAPVITAREDVAPELVGAERMVALEGSLQPPVIDMAIGSAGV